ncbi:MAG: protease inhibitor I42 family protein [Rhizomicrobium sp.]
MNRTSTRTFRQFAACAGVAASLFVACAGQSFAADAVVASEADAGKTISVPMGTPLVVNLSGSRGSGKYWRLDADLTPELVLSGRTTTSVEVPGAPETTSYTFTTNAPGTVTFKASYLKAGAPVPSSSDVVFTVAVTP